MVIREWRRRRHWRCSSAAKQLRKCFCNIENYGDGYASRIVKTFDMPLSEQKQLRKFEQVGILVNRMAGTSRIYTWNPRDPALGGLRELLRQTLGRGIPEKTLQLYFRQRQRPRRQGKAI